MKPLTIANKIGDATANCTSPNGGMWNVHNMWNMLSGLVYEQVKDDAWVGVGAHRWGSFDSIIDIYISRHLSTQLTETTGR